MSEYESVLTSTDYDQVLGFMRKLLVFLLLKGSWMQCRSRYYKAILLKIPFATSAYALAVMPFDSTRGKSAIMA